ncbi:hypothetical protein GUF51_19425, partial [Xanthomonas citri pv. citri]|nr:hypothetical protein [Xanthomonas citri pv. citri]
MDRWQERKETLYALVQGLPDSNITHDVVGLQEAMCCGGYFGGHDRGLARRGNPKELVFQGDACVPSYLKAAGSGSGWLITMIFALPP